MARRKTYSELKKAGQERPAHVRGQVVYKGFQCLAPSCTNFMFVEKSALTANAIVPCDACGFEFHLNGGESPRFDYEMVSLEDGHVVEAGRFSVNHAAYLGEAEEFKYCLLCYSLKPLSRFDRHASLASGRQGECNACKAIYNGIKNQTRLSDQHRESAQRRRLFSTLAPGMKIDSRAVYERFGGKCFNCGCALTLKKARMDHTLPVKLLWPITTESATLLCETCNGAKDRKWPSEFYTSPGKLKALSRLTGIAYDFLAGPPTLNQAAVDEVLKDVDAFIETWVAYPKDVKAVRRLVREHIGVDIFAGASTVPAFLKD